MYSRIFRLFLAFIISFLSSQLISAGLTSDQAIKKLKDGNLRYTQNRSIYPNLNLNRRTYTVKNGQHPYATIITCSDSRIPLEHVFDAGVGDIFVIRVAGNVVDIDEAGSIEYGVEHLHTPVFVVLGHTNCGAVTAVVKKAKVHGNIPRLVDNIIPAVKLAQKKHGDSFSNELLNTAIENNVWQSIEDLYKASHISLELVKEKKLTVIGAVYDLETGKVKWLGQHPRENELIEKYGSGLYKYFGKFFSTGVIIGLAIVLLSLVLFIIIYRLLFKEETRNKKYQIMTRISWGQLSIMISGLLAITAAYLFFGDMSALSLVQLGVLIILFTVLSLIFSRKYSNSIEASFKSVISKLKAMIKQ